MKYEGVEINTRIIDKILPVHKQRRMQPLDDYNVLERFDEQYAGSYDKLDQAQEDEKQLKLATQKIEDVLLPKITKTVPVKHEIRMEKQVIEGKRLHRFDKVDAQDGYGYQKFFAGYFQTVDAQPDEENIKINLENPA